MERSESIKELAGALAKAQGQIKGAVKDTANTFFKSKYADLASVVDAIRDALSANGIAYTQHVIPSDAEEVCIETILMHSSGEWMSCGVLALPVIKADAQGYGSAMTYARRYGLSAAVGVAPEDDDGNAAAGAKPSARQQEAKAEPKQEGPKPYPDADFTKNFPAWKKVIESGKKTAADLIAMIETKGNISDAQKSKLAALTRVRTAAEVEAAMRAATDPDTLALITVEQVATVTDPEDRKALMALHDELETALLEAAV